MMMEFDGMFSVNNLTKCKLRGKWVPLVAYLLRDGQPHHYSELKRQIKGVSQKMLTQTLRQLEMEGMVSRTVHPTVPPTVEYALTPEGMRALAPFLAMVEKVAEE
ncbi:MAG: helix-turn-helix transcriptional regulator [Anaerolineae bacterium]|nr:helix-turn-helix transcriptional regulator [Anaerolineae bacterium]